MKINKVINNNDNSIVRYEDNVFLFYDIHNMSKVIDTKTFIEETSDYIIPNLKNNSNNIGTIMKDMIDMYKTKHKVPYLKQEDIPSASLAIIRLANNSDILDLMTVGTNTIFLEYTNGNTRNIFYKTKIDKNNIELQNLSTMDGYETATLIKRNFFVAKYIRARIKEVKRIHVLSQEYSNLYHNISDKEIEHKYVDYKHLLKDKNKPSLQNGFYYTIDVN